MRVPIQVRLSVVLVAAALSVSCTSASDEPRRVSCPAFFEDSGHGGCRLVRPEVLHYAFDATGAPTVVANLASNPPTGAAFGQVLGALSQGDGGRCGGALVGSGAASSTDYVDTGWAPDLATSSWTISFWTSNIGPSGTLFYIWGDATNSLRCFTNGVAGANNWILRGAGITDVIVPDAATVASTTTTFVYDQAANHILAYVDGEVVNTVAQGAPSLSSGGPLKVSGYASNVGLPAGGRMDEFRVYRRALSPAEVRAVATAPCE